MASRRSRIGRDVPFGREEQPPLTMQEAADIIYADQNKLAELDRIQVRRERLPLDAIRLDGGTQPRAALNDALIDEYAEEMKAGANFPPGDVYYDGENYWLSSGFHRWHGRQRGGFEDMEVNVHQGTQRDAQLASVGENAAHGLRRSNEDKRRAVEVLLRDAQWGQWSDREIARQCKVSHVFVGSVRKELSGNRYQIGEEKRVVERSGQRFTQKRSRKKRQAAQQPEPPASESKTAPVQDASVPPSAIADALLLSLRGRSLTWGELYTAVEKTLGVFVDRDGFNATLRDFVTQGWVITDPNDQAAYMLARDGMPDDIADSEESKFATVANLPDVEEENGPESLPQVRRGNRYGYAVVDRTTGEILRAISELLAVDLAEVKGYERSDLRQMENTLGLLLNRLYSSRDAIISLRDTIARMARGKE